jgi:hypothetical protein
VNKSHNGADNTVIQQAVDGTLLRPFMPSVGLWATKYVKADMDGRIGQILRKSWPPPVMEEMTA